MLASGPKKMDKVINPLVWFSGKTVHVRRTLEKSLVTRDDNRSMRMLFGGAAVSGSM